MNPAKELLKTFEEWQSVSGTADQQIELIKPEPRAKAVRAVKLTMEIEEMLNVLENRNLNVEVYRFSLAHWQLAIFHYPKSWINNAFSSEDMNMLQALSALFDGLLMQYGSNVQNIEAMKPQLSQQLSELQEAFKSNTDLDESFVISVLWLIEHIQNAMNTEEGIDYSDFIESVRLLRVYVEAAAERSESEEDKAKFRTFVKNFFSHPLTNTFFSIAGTTYAGQLVSGS